MINSGLAGRLFVDALGYRITERSWAIRVPMPTPSLNQIQGKHWRVIHRMTQNMQTAVMVACANGPAIPKATGKRKVLITRHGKGILDADNLAGGAKSLIDALKLRGLLLDDDPAHVEVVYRQVLERTAKPYTSVEIQEAA